MFQWKLILLTKASFQYDKKKSPNIHSRQLHLARKNGVNYLIHAANNNGKQYLSHASHALGEEWT